MPSRIPTTFTKETQVQSSTISASLALPAPGANVSYLITHIGARLFTASLTPGTSTATVRLKDGATDVFVWQLPVASAVGSEAEVSQDGAWLIAAGAACTLVFDNNPLGGGSVVQDLLIQGTAV